MAAVSRAGRNVHFGLICCSALTAFACHAVEDSPQPLQAVMTTDSAQYVVLRKAYNYRGSIGFTYFNNTSGPVSQPGCVEPATLEKKTDSGWVAARHGLGSICEGPRPPFVIEQGTTTHFVYDFFGCEPGNNCEPEILMPVDGTYRLRSDFQEGRKFDKSARVVTATSDEFRITAQKAPGYVSPFGKFVCGPTLDSLASGTVVADIRLKASSGKLIADNSDIQRIEAAGGEVLHRFNIELVRARLSTETLKSFLSPSGIGDYAIVVSDPTRYEADVRIFFSDSATDADRAAVNSLLVSPDRDPPSGYSYSLMSDSLIPAISDMRGVKIVRARELWCQVDL